MFLRLVYDDGLAQAAYLVGCQKTGEAIVFDPERDVDRYIDLAKANGLKIVATAETHIHADFLSGSRELAERVGAKVYVSDEGDADWKYGWLDSKRGGGSYDHQLLKDGDRFSIGNIEIEAVHTPGHTPEHLMFKVYDKGGDADEAMGLVTGDFVFVGDLGRPDLLETAAGFEGVKEKSAEALYESAKKFIDLPDYLQVWPAHGAGSACGKALGAVPTSTVGYEKRFNPALLHAQSPDEFVGFILEGQPEPPLYFARMKQQNRDGVPLLGRLPSPEELGADDAKALRGSQRVAVIDVRAWDEFREGHLPGSLWAKLGSAFHPVAGSYVDPSQEVYLVVDGASAVEPIVRELVRIGIDKVRGFVTGETMRTIDGLVKTKELSSAELRKGIESGELFVLDVRRAAENAEASIPGATNVAHTRLPNHLDELPKDKEIVVHCRSGVRSASAASLLEREGFDVVNLAGGFLAWEKSGGKTERHEPALT